MYELGRSAFKCFLWSFKCFFWCSIGVYMLCCSSLAADIMRELQLEINMINISMNVCEWNELELEYLKGRSEGLFRAIEIIEEHTYATSNKQEQ